jgi:penicillin-insensitive murein DD-endopeptidase
MPWFAPIVLLLVASCSGVFAQESQCFGTVGKGRIERSVALPESGKNFVSYSSVGVVVGRTHVHSKVAEVVLAAYAALATEHPTVTYMYGETGWPSGGRIRPHRTHQNGLSVDFFVPVRNDKGKSVHLPTNVTNKFGYGIDFNAAGTFEGYSIDFPAIGEHIYQLTKAAEARGVGIALVIFDPTYIPKLLATPRGNYLRTRLNFMKGTPWVRHDEHYHIDFAVACKPLGAA